MGGFFQRLQAQSDANARRAVQTYADELPEYRRVLADPAAGAALAEFAVYLRRRTGDLAAEEEPFSATDLAVVAAAGQDRAEHGVSLDSQRRVLMLYSQLTMRDVYEAAGPQDVDQVLRMFSWLSPQGAATAQAYMTGYLKGQKRFLSSVDRVQLLARMLIEADPLGEVLALDLGVGIADRYLVLVARMPDEVPVPNGARSEILSGLLARRRVPMTWSDPAEFIALLPSRADAVVTEEVRSLSADLCAAVDRRCAIGTATAAAGALAETVELARQISRAAPLGAAPGQVYEIADVFVELGVQQVPVLERWLAEVAVQLSIGPDLVTTLSDYYCHDMNRTETARSLRIHPRTLDYRLQRVRELTGLEAGSTRGVRILSAAVARVLAGP
jgi:PucR-like helix-turn-helix protein